MTKDDLSPEDWQLIVSAPSLVGLAVSAASPSGPLGVVKEMFAVGMSMVDLARKRENNALIQALMEDVRHQTTKTERPEHLSHMDEAQAWALSELAQVPAALDRGGGGAEADAFKQWLVDVAARVAEASKEGGFFGIGGETVTDAEEQAIDEIRRALDAG